MTCEQVEQNIVLAQYGELADELSFPLEQHLEGCEHCRREWNAMLALGEELALDPVLEPSPNLLTASRLRLDEALDAMPPRSVGQRFLANFYRWSGFLQGAPALATLLIGADFLGGTVLARYQAAHAPQLPRPVIISSGQGPIASVSGIVQTPNSEEVQVKYNRIVPETVQGSLDDPQIRQLLMLGTKLATDQQTHADSVALLSNECLAGHDCGAGGGLENTSMQSLPATADIRTALLASLHYDKNPQVRLKALNGLQPYVAQDQRVRDAVLESVMHDRSSDVRAQAITLLSPVAADSSVRQALETVSQDPNPAVRNASFETLRGASDIQ